MTTTDYRPAFPGRSVLVVDLDDERRRECVAVLRRGGFIDCQSSETYHGAEFRIQKRREEGRPFDLVVTCLILQDGSGKTLAEHLKEDRAKGLTRTVLISRCELGTLELDSLKPLADYVCEELDSRELLEVARRLLGVSGGPPTPTRR